MRPSRRRLRAALLGAIILPCGGSPNCVSSTSDEPAHHVDPIPCAVATTEQAIAAARDAVESLPRTTVTGVQRRVVHAEFRSRILRMVDDVVLVFDEQARYFHVLSVSRTGWFDFGVNRRRVQELRNAVVERCVRAHAPADAAPGVAPTQPAEAPNADTARTPSTTVVR